MALYLVAGQGGQGGADRAVQFADNYFRFGGGAGRPPGNQGFAKAIRVLLSARFKFLFFYPLILTFSGRRSCFDTLRRRLP